MVLSFFKIILKNIRLTNLKSSDLKYAKFIIRKVFHFFFTNLFEEMTFFILLKYFPEKKVKFVKLLFFQKKFLRCKCFVYNFK